MDIILKPILNFIQDLEGMSNSVLAGGAVRDATFGLQPKDYDIFVPSRNRKQLANAVSLIQKEFTTSEVKNKSKDYELKFSSSSIRGTNLVEVFNFTYKDRDIDIIGVYENDDEDFPTKTIEEFDYGINMIYDTGRYVDDTHPKFQRDYNNHYMTLYRIESLSRLPKAMRRFDSFNNRIREQLGYEFYFDSPIIHIESEKTKKIKSVLKQSSYEVEVEDEAPTFIPTITNAVNTPATGWGTNTITPGIHTGNANTTATTQFLNTVNPF